MAAISTHSLVLFFIVLVGQLIGVALLPKTDGYTNIGFSVLQLAMFGISFAAMSRLLRGGVPLGILIPILSGAMPLASVLISITFYHESASLPRVAMLLAACVLIFFAGRH
jgi:multidrug transporter EmrE-like cation transporter